MEDGAPVFDSRGCSEAFISLKPKYPTDLEEPHTGSSARKPKGCFMLEQHGDYYMNWNSHSTGSRAPWSTSFVKFEGQICKVLGKQRSGVF